MVRWREVRKKKLRYSTQKSPIVNFQRRGKERERWKSIRREKTYMRIGLNERGSFREFFALLMREEREF